MLGIRIFSIDWIQSYKLHEKNIGAERYAERAQGYGSSVSSLKSTRYSDQQQSQLK
jgi:hypothetical protein